KLLPINSRSTSPYVSFRIDARTPSTHRAAVPKGALRSASGNPGRSTRSSARHRQSSKTRPNPSLASHDLLAQAPFTNLRPWRFCDVGAFRGGGGFGSKRGGLRKKTTENRHPSPLKEMAAQVPVRQDGAPARRP